MIATFALGAAAAGCSSQPVSSTPDSSGAQSSAAPAASSAPVGSDYSIAFVTNNASDYWTIVRKGAEAAIAGKPNVHLQFIMPADAQAATQKSDVDDAIAKGVKAIAISPIDAKNQTPWLDEVAAKVPLITQDSDAPDSKRLCYIGTDNHAAGLMAGQLIREALPQGGKIMLFVGKRDAQNAHDRELGVRDALKGSNIQILDVRTDDADHGRAKTNAADALVHDPDLAAMVGLWSYNGPAILSAVQDANDVGKVKIICFDEEDQTLAGIKSGAIYGTVVQQPWQFGNLGTKMLMDLANGNTQNVPKSGLNIIATQAIKKDNVDAFKAKLDKLRGRTAA